MYTMSKFLIAFALLLLPCSHAIAEQENKEADKQYVDSDFLKLREDRRVAVDEIARREKVLAQQKQQLDKLTAEAADDLRLHQAYATKKQRIEQIIESRKRPGAVIPPPKGNLPIEVLNTLVLEDLPNQDLARVLTDTNDAIAKINARTQQKGALEQRVQAASEDLDKGKNALRKSDDEIGFALAFRDAQNQYRMIISLTFAAIVMLLVASFFNVVRDNNTVMESIFSGDAGIQFITLFSIVVAVILFGILEILGANELSALLGGLSGYILGKTGAASQKTGAQPIPPAAKENVEAVGVVG